VLAVRGDNPIAAQRACVALQDWVRQSWWSDTFTAYARCARITRNLEETYELAPKQFAEPAEKALVKAYQSAARNIGPDADVDGFLTVFAPMVPAISTFFAPADEGGVLVMHEDPAIRQNRLALLQHIVALASGIVDLSRLEGF
jgi:glycyl-tRNA synthetase beta subunit